uniref:GK20552 n=1 Tax=Drosophila willistoni TaxID=7260 RepID=B4N5D6_DROWI
MSGRMSAKSRSSSSWDDESEAETIAIITNDDEKGSDLLSNSQDIFTPHWNWQEYIDKDTVPENLMTNMEDISESSGNKRQPHYTPLTSRLNSSRSHNSLFFDLEAKTTMDHGAIDCSMSDLWNVVKYPKGPVTNEVFKMSDLELMSARWTEEDNDETETEVPDIDDGIQSMLNNTYAVNTPRSVGSCYDFEMVFKPMNVVEEDSLALFLNNRNGKELTPVELLTICILPMAVMPLIYDWMLTESEELDVDDQFIPLFIAAMYLGVQQLLEHYWYTLSLNHDMGLCEMTAFHAYMKGRILGCGEILPILVCKLRKIFIPLVASTEFLRLTAHEVHLLFKQDTICVNCEDEVFFAAVRWFEFNWPVRKKFVNLIMSAVRFRHLSPWLRRSLDHLRENDLIKEISEMPQVTARLWDSAKYCTAWMTGTTEMGRRKRTIFSKYLRNKCIERYWVYCPGVPHHHDIKCPRYRELTYNTFKRLLTKVQTHFLDYIDSLKFIPNKYWNTFKCCPDIDLNAENTRVCPRPKFYSTEVPYILKSENLSIIPSSSR